MSYKDILRQAFDALRHNDYDEVQKKYIDLVYTIKVDTDERLVVANLFYAWRLMCISKLKNAHKFFAERIQDNLQYINNYELLQQAVYTLILIQKPREALDLAMHNFNIDHIGNTEFNFSNQVIKNWMQLENEDILIHLNDALEEAHDTNNDEAKILTLIFRTRYYLNSKQYPEALEDLMVAKELYDSQEEELRFNKKNHKFINTMLYLQHVIETLAENPPELTLGRVTESIQEQFHAEHQLSEEHVNRHEKFYSPQVDLIEGLIVQIGELKEEIHSLKQQKEEMYQELIARDNKLEEGYDALRQGQDELRSDINQLKQQQAKTLKQLNKLQNQVVAQMLIQLDDIRSDLYYDLKEIIENPENHKIHEHYTVFYSTLYSNYMISQNVAHGFYKNEMPEFSCWKQIFCCVCKSGLTLLSLGLPIFGGILGVTVQEAHGARDKFKKDQLAKKQIEDATKIIKIAKNYEDMVAIINKSALALYQNQHSCDKITNHSEDLMADIRGILDDDDKIKLKLEEPRNLDSYQTVHAQLGLYHGIEILFNVHKGQIVVDNITDIDDTKEKFVKHIYNLMDLDPAIISAGNALTASASTQPLGESSQESSDLSII